VRQHRLLVHQLPEVEIRLPQRRADPPQQPRLDLARDAEHQRRDRQHQQHLQSLCRQIDDHRHAATISSSRISVMNTSVR
jgi:hypothetical protein